MQDLRRIAVEIQTSLTADSFFGSKRTIWCEPGKGLVRIVDTWKEGDDTQQEGIALRVEDLDEVIEALQYIARYAARKEG